MWRDLHCSYVQQQSGILTKSTQAFQNKSLNTVFHSPQLALHPHFLSGGGLTWMGRVLPFNGRALCGASSAAMAAPLRAMSSRAIRMKAASTFWASMAEVSRAASTLLFSASVHASSNSTCRFRCRSDLFPAARQKIALFTESAECKRLNLSPYVCEHACAHLWKN